MHFVDNVVDTQTGTIQGTAVVSNDQGLLYPGLFGQARLIGRAEYDALLLPEQAINTDQNKKFVYVVNADNQVERRYVNVGTLLDNGLLVIDDGLSAEDRVVITGKQRIRAPMQLVTPVETPLTWTPIETLVYTPETPSSQVEE
jgi:RND family efflux transporter MFP subunit